MSPDRGFVPAESVTIRDQLAVVRRRWRVVAMFIIVALLGGAAYLGARSTSYVSHAQVQVTPVLTNLFQSTANNNSNNATMPTEQKIASSQTVAAIAARKLGTKKTPQALLKHLSVSVPATTTILDFAYSAGSKKAAQAGAKAFEEAYLTNRRAQITSEIAIRQNSYNKLHSSLLKQLQQLQQHSGTAQQINLIQQQLRQVNSALTNLQGVDPTSATVQEQATLPTSPSGASLKIVLAAALVVGIALGLIVAFVLDALDDHIHGPGDLAALTGAPVLSRVPVVRNFPPWRRHDLAAEGTSHPKVAEAYRLLANRLLVAASRDSIGSIMVASPAQGEGRSSVAANLAATFVELGCRVWLVSGDLVPPQVHKLFSPNASPGLVSVLPIEQSTSTGVAELAIGGDDNSHGHLTLMTTATVERQQTGRLLNPLVLAHQIRENSELVDLTIIDAPALLDFADAVPLIPVVDGVLIVADAGATRRSELIELGELLAGTRARVIGSVLNRDGSRVVSRRARRARQRLASRPSGGGQRRAGASRNGASEAASGGAATSPTGTPGAPGPTPAPAAWPMGGARSAPEPSKSNGLGWPQDAPKVPSDAADDGLVGWL
jgi:Mrp family chromosome partitioning ATPase/capsular polysaccharide biosynthesis protein